MASSPTPRPTPTPTPMVVALFLLLLDETPVAAADVPVPELAEMLEVMLDDAADVEEEAAELASDVEEAAKLATTVTVCVAFGSTGSPKDERMKLSSQQLSKVSMAQHHVDGYVPGSAQL